MSMNNRKIAGFMSAEGIYSLAFYIIMVAAIAGIGASVLAKKDAAKAASAISLLRANFVADSATLGVPAAIDADYIAKLSGNLIASDGTDATLPDDAVVTITVRTAAPSFSINVVGLASPEICNAIGGVGWGTWDGFSTAAVGAASAFGADPAMSSVRADCDAAAPGALVTLTYGFNI